MGAEQPRPNPDTWQDRAACRGADPAIFYPEVGSYAGAAKAFCRACPVQRDCLLHALANEDHGMWGGLSERERAQLRKQRADLL